MIKHIYDTYEIIIYDKYKASRIQEVLNKSRIIVSNPYDVKQEKSHLEFTGNYHRSNQIRYISPLGQFDFLTPHPYAGFKPQPSAIVGDGWLTTNELGHRSKKLDKKKEGILRIAMVGGSTAFLGNKNDETIIGELSRLLTELGYEVEYINAATVGHISNQELSVLTHELIDLEPDIILSFDGYNDINHLYIQGRVGWPGWKWNSIYYEYYPGKKKVSESDISLALANYLNNIEKMALISNLFGADYIAVLQPTTNFDRSICNSQSKLGARLLFYCLVTSKFEEWDTLKHHNSHYLGLGDLFSKNQELFIDQSHFDYKKELNDDHPNKAIARSILEKMVRKGLIEDKIL